MKRHFWIRLAVSLVLGLVLALLGVTPGLGIDAASAQVPPSGTFTASSACAATQAINGRNPGGIEVSKGQRYQAIGFNSDEQEFILIKVPGVRPERRWVRASCGTFTEATDVGSRPSPGTPTPTALLPFFDNVDNPEQHKFPPDRLADITPPAPELNDFDRDVLQTCGSIGSRVTADAFKQLMLKHPEVLGKIKDTVGGQILPVQGTEFVDDLTTVWSERGGFEHIFCGELEGPEKIGGLHFVGRYLELQENGIGGRLPNNLMNEEVEPDVIQTLGVVIKDDGQTWIDTLKGYAVVTNAEELLLNATKALKAQGNIQGGCILNVVDEETGKSFKARLFKDRRAIVTFYPDATPTGNGTNDRPCRT